MRKFYLENSIGQRIDLNGATGIRFINPAGLGFDLTGTYASLGTGFFVDISGDEEPQLPIVGDIIFSRGETYSTYRDFLDWLMQDYDLFFVYCPFETREYYRKVKMSYMSKTEKETVNILRAPVSFAPLTPWFLPTPFRTIINYASTGYKRYPYRYPYRYPASRQEGAVEVTVIGHLPAAIRLEYAGLLTNPSIVITGETTGKIYGQCDISATLESTDKLLYSSEKNNSYIKKQAADGTITDLIDVVDVADEAKEPFPEIPAVEPCRVALVSSTAITNNADIWIYNYYRGG